MGLSHCLSHLLTLSSPHLLYYLNTRAGQVPTLLHYHIIKSTNNYFIVSMQFYYYNYCIYSYFPVYLFSLWALLLHIMKLFYLSPSTKSLVALLIVELNKLLIGWWETSNLDIKSGVTNTENVSAKQELIGFLGVFILVISKQQEMFLASLLYVAKCS